MSIVRRQLLSLLVLLICGPAWGADTTVLGKECALASVVVANILVLDYMTADKGLSSADRDKVGAAILADADRVGAQNNLPSVKTPEVSAHIKRLLGYGRKDEFIQKLVAKWYVERTSLGAAFDPAGSNSRSLAIEELLARCLTGSK